MKIDVHSLIKSKSPALACVRPFVGYLRRTIHEREINQILDLHREKPPVEFIRAVLAQMGVSYEMRGLEHLDPSKRYVFAANHPFGGLDGLMLAERIATHFGDVRVVVNDLLMNLAPLRPIFIPVNTLGRQNTGYANLLKEAFASDVPIVTFPAGKCSRRRGGRICDPEWRSTFIKQAVATGRDVVPVFVEGRLSSRFYNLANLRTALGLRANIEMLYLPDEMFRQRGSHFTVTALPPIPWQEFDDGTPLKIHAQHVKDMVYSS